MSRSQKSVPMFFKFLAGCLLLAFLLIIGGGMVVHFQTQLRSRGNYLKPPFKHYLEYQQEMGRAVVAVADVVSGEPSLRRALAEYRSDDAGASAAEASPDDADPSGVTEAAPRTASPAALASDIFERLRSKHSIQPDLMLVVDDQGGHVWSRIIGEAAIDGRVGAFDPQDMGDMEAVNRVRSGATLRNTVLIHNGRAYQIAGVPVRAPGARQIVGGLLIGTALDRYMDQFESHSDPDRPLQLRLVLIAQGQVVAASVPPSVWTELAQNLSRTPDSWSYAHDRGTYRQRIIKLQRGDASDELLAGSYDVYGARDGQDPDSDMALVRGFDGLVAGEVGELYMLRSRDDVSRRRPTIPWTEGLIGIALSCGVAFLLAMWITRPIQDFVRQTRQLLAGETNLTQRIEIRSRDETQALAQNINKAFERLYRLATEVHSAAFQV
ncbi:MAG: methyl-accepting chemotaxis protein, partial [Myxococcota bacterium]